jgi:N-acylglucosamine-6-phosphate 2-epimerase
MVAMARAVVEGGAAAIRCESPADISAIRAAVSVPLIGLWKRGETGVYITPTVEAAQAVVNAGADAVAVDATCRERPVPVADLIRGIVSTLNVPVLADVSTLDEGLAAQAAGAAAVAPTLSGYTSDAPPPEEADWELLGALVEALDVPVLMEGRVWLPGHVERAFSLGAWAVVVGSAITRPQLITARFAQVCPGRRVR